MFKEIRERLESDKNILKTDVAFLTTTHISNTETLLQFADEAMTMIKLGFSDKQYYREYQDFLKRWEGK